jgi:hypothetical protein
LLFQGDWQEDDDGSAAMGGGCAVAEEDEVVGRYPWKKSAVAESFLSQTGSRSCIDDALNL